MDPILLIDKLSKLQRRAPRVITGGTYDVRPMHRNITIEQSLKNREVMTFKALSGRLPNYFAELFTRCKNNRHSLRSNSSKLKLPT